MAIEMLLDIEIFKFKGPTSEATIVPLVFPLIAGAGSFTTLLSLKAEYDGINIILALLANALVVYTMLRSTSYLLKVLGKGGIYFTRKFFGIILLAISVKLFTSNLLHFIDMVSKEIGS